MIRPQSVSTLVDLLRLRAQQDPQSLAYSFHYSEQERVEISYGELDAKARAIAAALQREHAPGDRAVILYPPGLEYIAAYFGCLYAGMVAVPAYPPDPSLLKKLLPRLQGLIRDSQPSCVMATADILAFRSILDIPCGPDGEMKFLATDTLDLALAEEWKAPRLEGDSLAFLQYTSGSTSAPKGVMVSHGNLLANLGLISDNYEMSRDSVMVSWLPPYHDMGLIGGILSPLFVGFPAHLMSPYSFLKRPLLWLGKISELKGTIAGGPNFAFDLCVRKTTPEERASLDLSRWKIAFNGAERIRGATLDRFHSAFGASGFRRESFSPCYGLAEATLIASGGKPGEAAISTEHAEASPTQRLVGCGRSLPGQKILIVDPETREIKAEGEIGEVWLRGPSVALGYWSRPQESEEIFGATPIGSTDRHLRTGDLGFLKGPELFITGRLKEVLILQGKNHYPQDIEITAEKSHPALRPGCGAALSLEQNGEESLAIVYEIERRSSQAAPKDINLRRPNAEVDAFSPALDSPPDYAQVAETLRRDIGREHHLVVETVVFLKAGTFPKTSSGKLQRLACRKALIEGGLDVVYQWSRSAPRFNRGEVEAWLRAKLAEKLGTVASRIGAEQSFADCGFDSVEMVDLIGKLEALLAREFPSTLLWDYPTIPSLLDFLEGRKAGAEPRSPVATKLLKVERVQSSTELKKCFELRHKIWFEELRWLSAPLPEGLERDEYDHNAVHFLATLDSDPIGTSRILLRSEQNKLPMEEMVDLKIFDNEKVAEVSRFMVSEDHRDLAAGILITKALFEYGLKNDIAYFVCLANPDYLKVYEGFGMEAFDETKFYPKINRPGVPMRMHLKSSKANYS